MILCPRCRGAEKFRVEINHHVVVTKYVDGNNTELSCETQDNNFTIIECCSCGHQGYEEEFKWNGK